MHLAPPEAARFLATYKKLLEEILSQDPSAASRKVSGLRAYVHARTLYAADRNRLELAVKAIRARGETLDTEVIESVRTMRIDTWFYLKNYAEGAALLDKSDCAYRVLALNDRLDTLADGMGCVITTGVLRFAGYYVCDGLVIRDAVLGPNYRKSFSAKLVELNRKKLMRTRTGPEILEHDNPEW